MPVVNSDGEPVRTLFGATMPSGTGAPGSEPSSHATMAGQSPSSRLGLDFGQVVPQTQPQLPQGPETNSPQLTQAGLTTPDGYIGDGGRHPDRTVMTASGAHHDAHGR